MQILVVLRVLTVRIICYYYYHPNFYDYYHLDN